MIEICGRYPNMRTLEKTCEKKAVNNDHLNIILKMIRPHRLPESRLSRQVSSDPPENASRLGRAFEPAGPNRISKKDKYESRN